MDIPLWLTICLQVLLQIVFIMLNAVFACAEIAVIETKGAKLDSLAENGNKKAKRLKRLTDQPARPDDARIHFRAVKPDGREK